MCGGGLIKHDAGDLVIEQSALFWNFNPTVMAMFGSKVQAPDIDYLPTGFEDIQMLLFAYVTIISLSINILSIE